MPKAKERSLIPVERIASRIYLIGEQKIMFDFDLAELYGVPTKALNQAVTRNIARFPDDFMFRLSPEDTQALNRSQSVTGSQKHRDPRFPPRVFTQEGVAMLSSVLRSKRAVEVNVAIMRAFVRLREVLATNAELARKVAQHDRQIAVLTDSIQRMLALPRAKKRSIGYIHPKDDEQGRR